MRVHVSDQKKKRKLGIQVQLVTSAAIPAPLLDLDTVEDPVTTVSQWNECNVFPGCLFLCVFIKFEVQLEINISKIE